VDDEQDAAAEMKDMIEQSAYTVFTAYSVPEARKALEEHPEIGVVISDIRMPGPSGLEFLKELSKRDPKDAIRAIIVTGYASYDSVVDALRNRAFDFLTKPLARDSLMARVDDAISEIEILRSNGSVDSIALKNILRKRETRTVLFKDFEYSEAAWDILIELTAARLEGRRLDVSGLCLLTHVSRTTAWRTIQSLVNAGMLIRIEDPDDRRRIHVELVDHVFETVRDFARSGAI
jgi:response regulator RpfG family c-di-GMP phosphodiesterase